MTPEDRQLPALSATDETFDQAYAQFILYCNPSFPLSTDISELKRIFRTPPKSDGRSFSTYHLFELLKKLEARELKTWTDLALELGVERPNVDKGQSSQKVQQYSVRLKRWMRALHIDAFFEYLMGKKHSYFLAVPPVNDPFPESRDGVPIEEDLAIRAIDPKFRPKRGRRRADEAGEEEGESKRQALEGGFGRNGDESAYPLSAYPMSAVPGSAHPDFGGAGSDPWASLTPGSALPRSAHSQTLRWHNETPSTPHPLSAVTPMSAPSENVHVWGDEPLSAVTPSSARSGTGRRRRHGPAVSSAWPSTNTTANGKLRGRPPSNRSVRDGPFVTFPADPRRKEGPVIELRQGGQGQGQGQSQSKMEVESEGRSATPSTTESPRLQPVEHHFITPQLPTPVSANQAPIIALPTGRRQSTMSDASSASGRPERLQLQVPRHVGGPVHLLTATPPMIAPPTLLVNGVGQRGPPVLAPAPVPALAQQSGMPPTSAGTTSGGFLSPATKSKKRKGFASAASTSLYGTGTAKGSGSGNDDLKRGLVAGLLKADVSGRPVVRGRRKKLGGLEARALADAMLARTVNPASTGDDDKAEENAVVYASWLGLSSSSSSSTAVTRKVIIHRSRIDKDGFESPVDDELEISDDAMDGGEREAEGEGDVKEIFDVEWTASLGGIEGRFAVRGLVLGLDGTHDRRSRQASEEDEGGGDWKARFERLREEHVLLRERVLDAVV